MINQTSAMLSENPDQSEDLEPLVTPIPRIRVLHLTFNMGYGGTEQVIRQLVRHLDPTRFESEILCLDGTVGSLGESLRSEGYVVESLQRKPGLDTRLIKSLRRWIRDHDIQVVHCHQYTPWTYGWLAHWGTGCRLVFTEHGRFYPDKYRFKAALLNLVMAATTPHVVAISAATRQALRRYEFVPAKRVQVIHNGIAGVSCSLEKRLALKTSLGLTDEHQVIGTVARLDPVKNQVLMIEAVARLRDAYPNLRLLLVGDGPSRLELEARVQQLQLQKRVIFTGYQAEPGPYLAIMDLFLLTSLTEGTSMTLLEAMSLGTPPIVTDVGGNPEIVSTPEFGALVPSNDFSALAEAIDHLLQSPERRQRIAVAVRQRFATLFAIDTMVRGYALLYEQ